MEDEELTTLGILSAHFARRYHFICYLRTLPPSSLVQLVRFSLRFTHPVVLPSLRAAGPVRPWNGPSGRTEPVRLRGEWMNEVSETR